MNRFFTLLLSAFCLTAVGQLPDYVPTDGLVGWWLNGSGADLSGNGFEFDFTDVVTTDGVNGIEKFCNCVKWS